MAALPLQHFHPLLSNSPTDRLINGSLSPPRPLARPSPDCLWSAPASLASTIPLDCPPWASQGLLPWLQIPLLAQRSHSGAESREAQPAVPVAACIATACRPSLIAYIIIYPQPPSPFIHQSPEANFLPAHSQSLKPAPEATVFNCCLCHPNGHHHWPPSRSLHFLLSDPHPDQNVH